MRNSSLVTAQAASASSTSITVVDIKTRQQFMFAISDACLPDKMNKIVQRLAMHFNCKTMQCNPGYDYLQHKLGISESTLMRGLRDLEADGWIIRRRRGRDQNVEFTLCIPASIPVIQATPMADDAYLSGLTSIAVKNGLHTCHYADSTDNNGTGEQESAPSARAARSNDTPVSISKKSEVVDTAERVFDALLDDLFPLECSEPNEQVSKQLLEQLLRDGETADEIRKAAADYCTRINEQGGPVLTLEVWLEEAPWKKRSPC